MRDSTAGQRKGRTSPYHKDRSDMKNKEVKWGRKEGRTHISNLPYPRESTETIQETEHYSRIHSDRLVHVDTGMRGLLHTSISQRERSFKLADRRRCEGPRKQSVSEPRRLEGHGCGESTRNSREGGMAREDCLRKSSANKGSTE